MAVKQDGALTDRSLRDYLAVLEDTHRQAVVSILAGEENAVSLSVLAEQVAKETQSPNALDQSGLKRLKIELHHSHLPRLNEAGVLEYSPEDHIVVPTDETRVAQRAAKALSDI